MTKSTRSGSTANEEAGSHGGEKDMRAFTSCYWRDGCLLHLEVKCPKCKQYMILQPAELIISDGGELTVQGQQAHNSPDCDARFRIIGSEIIIEDTLILGDDDKEDTRLGLRGRIPGDKTDHD